MSGTCGGVFRALLEAHIYAEMSLEPDLTQSSDFADEVRRDWLDRWEKAEDQSCEQKEAEKHCHQKDNEHLLARAERAEAAARDFALPLAELVGLKRSERDHDASWDLGREALSRHPGFLEDE